MNVADISRKKINEVYKKYSVMDDGDGIDWDSVDNKDIMRMLTFLNIMAEIVRQGKESDELMERFTPIMSINGHMAFCYAVKELFPDD